jgi:hypothetical protein
MATAVVPPSPPAQPTAFVLHLRTAVLALLILCAIFVEEYAKSAFSPSVLRSVDGGAFAAVHASVARGAGGAGGPISFNAVSTTMGRATLGAALRSVAPQLRDVDYLTLISDNPATAAATLAVFADVPCNCTKLFIANARGLGDWGHRALNRYLPLLPGTFATLFDDDDLYAADAFARIRARVTTRDPHLYVFRLIRFWDGVVEVIPPFSTREVWQLRPHFIAKVNGVFRNTGDLPAFGYTYLGDAQFYMDLIMRLGSEGVTVCDDVVYHQGQDRELWPHLPGLIAQAASGAPSTSTAS